MLTLTTGRRCWVLSPNLPACGPCEERPWTPKPVSWPGSCRFLVTPAQMRRCSSISTRSIGCSMTTILMTRNVQLSRNWLQLSVSPASNGIRHTALTCNRLLRQLERDGIITENEQKLITMISDTLGIADVAIPQVTELPPVSSLRIGMRVCFTGSAIVEGKPIARDFLEKTAAQAGMQPVGSVTRKNCDLLVAADSSSRSGKTRKARDYGIPVMTVEEFLNCGRKKYGLTSARQAVFSATFQHASRTTT